LEKKRVATFGGKKIEVIESRGLVATIGERRTTWDTAICLPLRTLSGHPAAPPDFSNIESALSEIAYSIGVR
jgi:hypothetical protein